MADSLIEDHEDQTNDRRELEAKWKDKSPEEVLKAKVESDLYIKTLTSRMDELRGDYLKLREEHQASAQLKDLIDQLKQAKPNEDTPPDTNRENVSQPAFKPEDIDTMLEQKLTARERLNKQTENFNIVKAKLREQFGDNANSILRQRMDTLGLDQAFVDELAKNHPTVFFRTFGMDQPERRDSYSPPPRTNQRQDNFAPKVQKRDWNYYQELKKSNPRLYLDPKISVQMHQDALEQGDAFVMPRDE